jgi:hypothetical protein
MKIQPNISRIGESKTSNQGYKMTITGYRNCKHITVTFEDGSVIETSYHNFNRGAIASPLHRGMFGVGYMGEGDFVSSINSKPTLAFKTWTHMLERVYSEKSLELNPSYKGCSVAPEWHNFQNFAQWHEDNHVDGYFLDKDLLVKGNKVYSPETARFIPRELNTLFSTSKQRRGIYPVGVTKRLKKALFNVFISLDGKNKYLGSYDTIEDGFKAYKSAKEAHIRAIAERFKDFIPQDIYLALMGYSVEYND